MRQTQEHKKYVPVYLLSGLMLSASSGLALAYDENLKQRGVEPLSPILFIYEKETKAVMELENPTKTPALLSTSINEIEERQVQSPVVHVLQPILRIEPHSRAKVRFQLESPAGLDVLNVQHLKRVWFESIPPATQKNDVAFNIRYDLPVLIHPKALPWEPEPWRHLQWCREGDALVAQNDSPYVIRTVGEVDLLPSGKKLLVFPSNVLLPQSRLRVAMTEQQLKEAGAIEKVRSFPATAWGFKVPESWTVDVSASCAPPQGTTAK